MLAFNRYHQQQSQRPWLVFLHGLLGSADDWQGILPYLTQWPCLAIDLPGHGRSQAVSVDNFAQVSRLLSQLINQLAITEYVLVGYSLGGRIAMYHTCYGDHTGLAGLVIEGGHLGLKNESERQQRVLHDQQWAMRFAQQNVVDVLQAWYQQPVFASLTAQQRIDLIRYRQANNGQQVAKMLQATSLGLQPWLGDKLVETIQQKQIQFTYLCGEQDPKFQQLAASYHLPLRTIAMAGHNAHQANPFGFAQQLILSLQDG